MMKKEYPFISSMLVRDRAYRVVLPSSLDRYFDPYTQKFDCSCPDLIRYIVAYWCDSPEFRKSFEEAMLNVFSSD